MKRIYANFAYSEAPRAGCWWDQTHGAPERPALQGDAQADVVIIGGGFTGLNAALHLARAGVGATVLEAERVGFGASGRNGGFCCLGGGMLDDAALDRKFGRAERLGWRQAEVAAIRQVEDFIAARGINVDRHSRGETQLAHRPRDFEEMRGRLEYYAENYGVTARLTEKADLAAEGLNAGFEGAITVPIGFGLNPRKYVTDLAQAAEEAGAAIYHNSPATGVTGREGAFEVTTPQGCIRAERVIIATNGYSSEDLPRWLAARYMPTQSSVIVTRPMTEAELSAQGWTSQQACYDSRHLLHYFRLMPDNRMLFGVRGGLMSNPNSERRALARARADFEAMFPAWRHVETPHGWSGMVCIARNRMPFVGQVPDQPGIFAGLCYHGNGVAMGSYSGALLADLVRGITPERPYPAPMRAPLARFELGRFRRAVMPFAYAGFALSDR
ncbi:MULTISPECIES: FAD-binding oxidoreductase [Sulfitobacter]|uniref:NAD(P)/FAD-dependent oxidoreductase n=1 Tax=Sulfitobacter TaxID=60136 RepID=UPI002306DE84|nr:MULTISPECIES: FAD-binding oxidoreductase [Sulfitobacter]MDF3381667.1 FAD-binding oxidoreductase [Sulfitobacter sp. Ks11]MDF3385086.1 FAD-binding oxidoreductase [Sulfitobacter sp. M85]MDF3388505.1 FAD-binding oxidoreductase [Sulfitobacter sp. Ks16]MDF3399142.1 FAD-binding oxidoreductase [Sulfitobacter sp. KE39]MDF3402563.1 FAD-binding oxidoreductase [Sulfitobacter sp. Ks35]